MPADVMTTSTPTASEPAPPSPPEWFGGLIDDLTLRYAIAKSVGDDPKHKQRIDDARREVVALAREVAGPNPNAVEWSLATTIALSWLAMRVRETTMFAGQDGETFRNMEYRWKLLNAATRRYNSLLKTLAAVRRAGSPAVQIVNAGGTNQTNIDMT